MFIRTTAPFFLIYWLFLFLGDSFSAETNSITPDKIVGIWQWVTSYPADSKKKEFYSQSSSSTTAIVKQCSFHIEKPTTLSKHSTGFSAFGVFQLENNSKINVGTYQLSGETFSVKFENPTNPNSPKHSWKVKIKRLTKNEAEVLSIEDNYVHVFKRVKK